MNVFYVRQFLLSFLRFMQTSSLVLMRWMHICRHLIILRLRQMANIGTINQDAYIMISYETNIY